MPILVWRMELILTGTLLFVLNAQGQVIHQGRLPGRIDSLAIPRRGDVLAATSGGRVALYPAPQRGNGGGSPQGVFSH